MLKSDNINKSVIFVLLVVGLVAYLMYRSTGCTLFEMTVDEKFDPLKNFDPLKDFMPDKPDHPITHHFNYWIYSYGALALPLLLFLKRFRVWILLKLWKARVRRNNEND